MEAIFETIPLLSKFGPGILIPVVCFAFVGILAQWSLYDKCGQPGIACIVPIWNVIAFLKITGRPAWHSIFVILPPPIILAAMLIGNPIAQYALMGIAGAFWMAFMVKVYIELCQSFGHYKTMDYLLVTAFNGFYVLHLGLSYKEKYRGPVYGQPKQTQAEKATEPLKSQLA